MEQLLDRESRFRIVGRMAVVLVRDSVVLEPAPYLTPKFPLQVMERGGGEVTIFNPYHAIL